MTGFQKATQSIVIQMVTKNTLKITLTLFIIPLPTHWLHPPTHHVKRLLSPMVFLGCMTKPIQILPIVGAKRDMVLLSLTVTILIALIFNIVVITSKL